MDFLDFSANSDIDNLRAYIAKTHFDEFETKHR